MIIRRCPLCDNDNASVELSYEPREFDQYQLSKRSLVKFCPVCGMIYTDHGVDDAAITAFYETNSLYSGSDAGFGTGGATAADRERYEWYASLLQKTGVGKNATLCDLGCGKGGFLNHLRHQGFSSLCAVDVDPRCVDYARRTHGIDVRQGTTDAIPFDDQCLDVVVAAQVMEHLGNVHQGLRECWRVLRPGGYLLIEVPDASRYARTRLYDFAWVALMEHINHFSPHTLDLFFLRNGFAMVTVDQADRTFTTPHRYPSLCMIGKKEGIIPPLTLEPEDGAHTRLSDHVAQEWRYARSRARWLKTVFAAGNRIACWGISREFFNMVRFSGLEAAHLHALYDKNPLKTSLTVSGRPIVHPDLIPADDAALTLLVTSVLHTGSMCRELAERGFRGTVLTLDQRPGFAGE